MSTERKQMETLFQTITTTAAESPSPGLTLYQQQFRYRRLAAPSAVFLHRLQNIWGPEFIWELLEDFFTAIPPHGHRWDRILAGLPAFIAQHEDYQRVLGLKDLTVLALKSWDCIHGNARELSYFPEDPIDLDALWLASASRVEGDPQTFWESLLRTGPRAFILAPPAKIL